MGLEGGRKKKYTETLRPRFSFRTGKNSDAANPLTSKRAFLKLDETSETALRSGSNTAVKARKSRLVGIERGSPPKALATLEKRPIQAEKMQ